MENNIIMFPSPAMALDARGELHKLQENKFVWRATADFIWSELTTSLALVCPVSMTEDDRAQWIASAVTTMMEVGVSPGDLRKANLSARTDPACDHPAKIIPAIMRALGPNWVSSRVEIYETDTRQPMDFTEIEARVKSRDITEHELNTLPKQWLQIFDCRNLVRWHGNARVYRLRAEGREQSA
ncbi:hypothetical protein [Sphingomonas paeninsulae]|nr:hypothetical protein [Sphingomonas paeninsulae]